MASWATPVKKPVFSFHSSRIRLKSMKSGICGGDGFDRRRRAAGGWSGLAGRGECPVLERFGLLRKIVSDEETLVP